MTATVCGEPLGDSDTYCDRPSGHDGDHSALIEVRAHWKRTGNNCAACSHDRNYHADDVDAPCGIPGCGCQAFKVAE